MLKIVDELLYVLDTTNNLLYIFDLKLYEYQSNTFRVKDLIDARDFSLRGEVIVSFDVHHTIDGILRIYLLTDKSSI
jgi:hypothetical protein